MDQIEYREVVRDTYGYKCYEFIHRDGATFVYDFGLGRFLHGEELIRVLQILQKPKDEASIRA